MVILINKHEDHLRLIFGKTNKLNLNCKQWKYKQHRTKQKKDIELHIESKTVRMRQFSFSNTNPRSRWYKSNYWYTHEIFANNYATNTYRNKKKQIENARYSDIPKMIIIFWTAQAERYLFVQHIDFHRYISELTLIAQSDSNSVSPHNHLTFEANSCLAFNLQSMIKFWSQM